MPEMPGAGIHHHHATLIHRINHFLIAHRATGMDDAASTSIDNDIEAVTEWEKCGG